MGKLVTHSPQDDSGWAGGHRLQQCMRAMRLKILQREETALSSIQAKRNLICQQ